MKNIILNVTNERAQIKISTRKGDRTVTIDPQDLDKAKQLERLTIYTDPKGRKLARSGKENDQVLLHRYLFDIPKGHKLEWINEDTLDLRRSNIRLINKDGVQVPIEQPKEPGRDVKPAVSGTPLSPPGRDKKPAPAGKAFVGDKQPGKKKQSEVRGVYFHKASERWHASAFHKGKRYSLGYFKSEDEAVIEVTLFRTYGPGCKELKRNTRKGSK